MLIWLLIAVLAAIGEVMTIGLYFASIAAAAVVTAVVALAAPVALQVIVFLIVSLVAIAVLRPIVLGALGMESRIRISGPVGQPHLTGRRAVVVRTVDSSGGQIRIGEGEFWSARSFDSEDVIEPGSPVEVQMVDGLTALVTPVARPAITTDLHTSDTKGR